MAKKNQQEKQEDLPQEKGKRKYVNQFVVPVYGLEEALKVPKAMLENFGAKPTAPFQVAKLPQEAFSELYLGCKTRREHEEEILHALESQKIRIPVYETSIDGGYFRLNAKRIH